MQGSRTYILQLARHLADSMVEDELFLYTPTAAVGEISKTIPQRNATVKGIDASRISRLVTKFPRQCSRDALDVLHVQYIAPFFLRVPYVVSLHDILHEEYPQFYPSKLRKLMTLLYPIAARKAERVIALSEYTKAHIIRKYKVAPKKVEVVYPGVAPEFFPQHAGAINEVRAHYGIDGEYLLYVGRIEPRKNLESLIKAFGVANQRNRLGCTMIIAGMVDPLMPQYLQEIQKIAQGLDVHFIGGVAQHHLPALYSGALGFVYPSHGEGFGLPVIEAMQCGVPVVASNVTSLPEAVGEAGIMISPTDIDMLANALEAIVTNRQLRAELIERGFLHAAKFSWRNTATQIYNIYTSVVG
ncbi:glycosyltransferase family 4 protein [Megalodesulfovibrio paquesii]